ncbi:cation:proton antiporter [Basilea psittacipulmonis]|uniref:Cyclic nucleotide-binding domain-containing protein n=1 Tax=Basilea psittacipulmonis DSM 24701 TaxID=1072685 RepID=A0A077DES0_9BURK|nr:cation:proton antiporter [Basilea psittacipulmonis]AIL33335.1 hypothetical protein IX83_08495 [Basilea psittacipulmonis DSM 24701]
MDTSLLFFAFALVLALACFIPSLSGKLRLPYTVVLSSVGCLIGLVARSGWFNHVPVVGEILSALYTMHISSEMLLTVFLPILLFESSMAMNLRKVMNDFGPIMVMAILAVFLTTAFVGAILSLFSTYGLIVCLLLGSIVATTDPVAVLGIFKEVGAPRRLITLLEGESLLNDAAALAMFSVLIATLGMGVDHLSLFSISKHFLYSFLMGALFGSVMGLATCWAFKVIRGFPAAEITLTLCAAYVTYIVGEDYFGVSGVVATVLCGLVVGNQGRTSISPQTYNQLKETWGQYGFFANSFIFLLAAMMIPQLVLGMTWADVGYTIILYIAVMLARAITVFGVLPLMHKLGLANKISSTYKTVISWGGLRGALSLALALSVTEHFGIPSEVKHFLTGATTLFVLSTLFINGLTLRPLIKYFRLSELSPLEVQLRDQALIVALDDSGSRTKEIAKTLELDDQTQAVVAQKFKDSIQKMREQTDFSSLDKEDQIAIGLGILSKREENHFMEMFSGQVIQPKVAQILVNDAERLSDAIVSGGRRGYVKALRNDLRYTFAYRVAWWLQTHFRIKYFLSLILALRLVRLLGKHGVIMALIQYCEKDLKVLLGEEIAMAVSRIQQARLQAVDDAVMALELTYPEYVRNMRVHFLGRVARSMEKQSYKEMVDQSIVTPEIYTELISDADKRWEDLVDIPPLDVSLSTKELMVNVPFFEGLDEQGMKEVRKMLKPVFAMPNQMIFTRSKYMGSLYFIASGAVSMTLADDTKAELGTGQMFGEMILLRRQDVYVNVRSLSYTRLLTLTRRELRQLMKKYPTIKEKVDEVLEERLYALQVWEKYKKHEEIE